MKRFIFTAIIFFTMISGALISHADVILPSLIGNNMVIQADKPVKFMGWADPGEKVTVTFAKSSKSAVTDQNCKWNIGFDSMKYGGPYEMTIQGKNVIKINNIMVGEVWVCSGQSNMHWPVRYSNNPETEIKNARHPEIRLFSVKKQPGVKPEDDCIGEWQESSPKNIADFSGAAYFFGRELSQKLGVTVGMIQSSWGGTPIETWMSGESIRSKPELAYVFDGWDQVMKEHPKPIMDYYELMSEWFDYAFICMGQKVSYDPIPKGPEGYSKTMWTPGWLYNGMISPLTKFPVRGAVWCQGESNAGAAYKYRTLLTTLIEGWRAQWNDDLPFIVIQMATTGKKETEETKPSGSSWAELQEAQMLALKLPKTACVVTVDLGIPDDVHYRNKQEVGRRTMLAASRIAYGQKVVDQGPFYDSFKIDGRKVIIKFRNPENGLTTAGDSPVKGFTIAGADSVFFKAQAQIQGDKIAVWSDMVKKPVAVRYAWGGFPDVNFVNKDGLPAYPFRTDDWPGVTYKK